MRKLVLPALCAALLAVPARGQETARDVIERGIQAHGGRDKLTRFRADKVKLKGRIVLGTREVAFTGSTTVQVPAQLKNVLELSLDDRTVTLTQLVNGEAVYVALDGQPQKVEPAAAAEMRETVQLARAVRLVPLLTDPAFTLELLAETKVADRPAVGVRVQAAGRRELRLYFDRATGRLVKTEHPVGDGAGKEVRQEEYYSDFRDLEGFVRPAKMTAFRDGKKVMEAVLTEVSYYDRPIPDAEFTKP